MNILLLGSTGSIGASTCNCVRRFPDLFRIVGVAAHSRTDVLLDQVREFAPRYVHVGDASAAGRVRSSLPAHAAFFEGRAGLERVAAEADYDVLLNALVGEVGLRPTVAALRRGKRVALANKESLVIGGDFLRALNCGELVPVDSEHSAILQCLSGEHRSSVESIILTASGGPFRELPAERFAAITPEEALRHPTWAMGRKITIDSATLMNKGFEVIEAHHLFQTPYQRLRVLIHPQSIVHSMVEFHDGSVISQMGVPSMELPIQFALSYPKRLPATTSRLDLAQIGALTFHEPDTGRFPCLRLCLEAGTRGGTMPAALNAANEVAVQLFLDKAIRFDQIPQIIEETLSAHTVQSASSVEVIEEVDRYTRDAVTRRYARGKD